MYGSVKEEECGFDSWGYRLSERRTNSMEFLLE